jgi:hypothetical protein
LMAVCANGPKPGWSENKLVEGMGLNGQVESRASLNHGRGRREARRPGATRFEGGFSPAGCPPNGRGPLTDLFSTARKLDDAGYVLQAARVRLRETYFGSLRFRDGAPSLSFSHKRCTRCRSICALRRESFRIFGSGSAASRAAHHEAGNNRGTCRTTNCEGEFVRRPGTDSPRPNRDSSRVSPRSRHTGSRPTGDRESCRKQSTCTRSRCDLNFACRHTPNTCIRSIGGRMAQLCKGPT